MSAAGQKGDHMKLFALVLILLSQSSFAAESTFSGWIKRFDIDTLNESNDTPHILTYFVLITGDHEGYVLMSNTAPTPGRTRTQVKSTLAGVSELANHQVLISGETDQYLGEVKDFGDYKILDYLFVSSMNEIKESKIAGNLVLARQEDYRKVLAVETLDGRTIPTPSLSLGSTVDGEELTKKNVKNGLFAVELRGSFQKNKFLASKVAVRRR